MLWFKNLFADSLFPCLYPAVAVVKHFDDINEDQFDFHAYCLRKVTLRAYVSVLRFEDELYGQSYFCEAAVGITRIYLHLADSPTATETAEPDYSKMSAAERKKAKAIARKKKKAEEKKESELRQKDAVNGGNKNQKGGKPAVVDEDPLGKELLKKDPLEEAKKYSALLARYAPQLLETWIIQYDVASRRKKSLMALQALFKARAIDSESGDLFSRIVDFGLKLDSIGDVPDAVKQVIDEESSNLFGNQPVSDFIRGKAESIRTDKYAPLPLRSAVARALVETKTASALEAASLITDGGMDAKRVTVDSCQDALKTLVSFGAEGSPAVERWTAAVQLRFPTSTIV